MQTQMTSTDDALAEPQRARARARGDRRKAALGLRSRDSLGRIVRSEVGAKGLGWLSIGLGLAQILAPRGFARLVGIGGDARASSATRAVGVRELVCGIGILAVPRPTGFLWARVAGDVMDLVLLGRSLDTRKADRSRVITSMAAVAGAFVVDGLAAVRASRTRAGTGRAELRRGIQVAKAITVNRSPEDVYGFWRDLQNLPRFMAHLESVEQLDATRSRWRAKAPAGMTVEWEAVLVSDRPNELLAWRSVEGSSVTHSGRVRFAAAPGGRGTEIKVDLRYRAPGGRIGAAIAKLFGEEPGQQIDGDLRRLKQVMETGDVVIAKENVR
jgi:uncharacterized membrane protein